MPRAPAAVRWLTPRSCRSRERVRENSAFKFLTSRGGPQAAVSGSHLDLQYIQYSITEALRHVKRKMKIFRGNLTRVDNGRQNRAVIPGRSGEN